MMLKIFDIQLFMQIIEKDIAEWVSEGRNRFFIFKIDLSFYIIKRLRELEHKMIFQIYQLLVTTYTHSLYHLMSNAFA